ncbi:MAG: class I SAM-dependent methyltransferase [Alistipes senegalensis]|nr:class I SAM-dependent methyltransferase [Oxalobacter formigenes]MCM1280365.1 class I SAM-dependent methyltransferase [Alistipes senegalensis]
MMIYSEKFYKKQMTGSRLSADVIVPIVMDMFKPGSVIDIGCGVGTWLSVFEEYGCKILGIDGNYVNRNMLHIKPDFFIPGDLSREIHASGKFDLAVSLEVAEHLPEARARSFVKELTNLSPVVLFSAAIPFQGGKNHVNEQWQDYWAGLFRAQGYYAFDAIRPKIQDEQHVAVWYKSNMLIYCNEEALSRYPELLQYKNNAKSELSFNMVHPDMYLWRAGKRRTHKKIINALAVFSAVLLLVLVGILFFRS